MKAFQSLYYIAIALIIVSILAEEVSARRKVLRGRKAITRTYYKGTAIPAWSISIIVGILMMGAGGAMYFVMNKIMFNNGTDSQV